MSADYFARLGSPIFAAATAKGGPLVVYRISGKSLTQLASALELNVKEERKANYRNLFNVDAGVAIFFRGPRSFTGEDVIEIHSHGSDRICELIERELKSRDIREALPGEFSFRAFVNQKMTLAEAEALHFALSAGSAASVATELVNLSPLAQTNTDLRFAALDKALASARGRLESAIDFSESVDEQAADVKSAHEKLNELTRELDAFLTIHQNFYSDISLPKVVILGEPNSGKSSLLNLLVGNERSLVSGAPGTTRDYIEARIKIKNQDFIFVDTAGIRSTGHEIDPVERKGIALALQLIEKSTAVVWVQASNRAVDPSIENSLSSHPIVIRIRSFGDLTSEAGALDLQGDREKLRIKLEAELLPKIAQRRDQSGGRPESFVSERQGILLRELRANISASVEALEKNRSLELVAEDLRRADALLKKCRGQDLSNDYLSEIFSQFCLGK